MLDFWTIFEEYGWYILLFAVVLLYIYSKIQPHIAEFLKQRAEREYAAKFHKNPDLFVKHVTAQQTYAEKLQEKYNQSLEQYKAKQQEKEERRRQEIVEQMPRDGYRLGGDKTTDNSTKKSFKPEYNPLMGSGPSSSYRPPKRSCCGGGGCG